MAKAYSARPHPEERALARVSKDEASVLENARPALFPLKHGIKTRMPLVHAGGADSLDPLVGGGLKRRNSSYSLLNPPHGF
jgi:hypothetical protein